MTKEELVNKIKALEVEIADIEDADEKQEKEQELQTLQSDLDNWEDDDDNDEDNDPNETELQKAVKEALSPMKANMDKMAAKLAEAQQEAKELKAEKKEAEKQKLRDEGKLSELKDMEISELKAKLELANTSLTKLNRDGAVRDALSGLEFRNSRAREIAEKDIIGQLEQDEDGLWQHKSGKPIADFINSFAKDSDNEFLFKVKPNKGNGLNDKNKPTQTEKPKSLLEMNSSQALEAARKKIAEGNGFSNG